MEAATVGWRSWSAVVVGCLICGEIVDFEEMSFESDQSALVRFVLRCFKVDMLCRWSFQKLHLQEGASGSVDRSCLLSGVSTSEGHQH